MVDIDFKSLDLDTKIEIIYLLDALRTARQIAYQAAKKYPMLRETYDIVEQQYVSFTKRIGETPTSPHDTEEHIKRRIAEGDSVYVALYGTGAGPVEE